MFADFSHFTGNPHSLALVKTIATATMINKNQNFNWKTFLP